MTDFLTLKFYVKRVVWIELRSSLKSEFSLINMNLIFNFELLSSFLFFFLFYSWRDIWYSWVLHTFTLDDWLFRHMNSEIHFNILRFLEYCRVCLPCLVYTKAYALSNIQWRQRRHMTCHMIFSREKASNISLCTHIQYKLFFSNMSFTFLLILKQTFVIQR